MTVRGFDHYNIKAPRELLDRLCSFYREVVGLTLGPRPAFKRFGYWLYAGEHAVLHLGETKADETCTANVSGTFSHAAFSCTDRPTFERRLRDLHVPYTTARVPQTRQVQLFCRDPAGNGVELCFASDDGAAANDDD